MSDIIEQSVCKIDELQIKERKVVRIENVGIVLYRKTETEIIAFGNKCSHYGAPLINGVIYGDYAICPWHGACFNINTGDIEEFPGCNNIPTFEIEIRDDDVYLRAKKEQFIISLPKIPIGRELSNEQTIIIIGGGPAGFQCMDTLRNDLRFDGRIVLVSQEDAVPYDRTKLSKNLACKLENIVLRNEDYYQKAQIELKLKTKCENLDTELQMAYLLNDNDDTIALHYDKIFIATGSRPRKYPSQVFENNKNLENVFYLRTYHDANNINDQIEDKNVILIGSSFIVIEIACSIIKSAKTITILSRTDVPYARTLGRQIGQAIKELLISKNIRFCCTGTSELEFELDSESKRIIRIKSEGLPESLDCDVCVIGIGSIPNTDFLKDSPDIQLSDNHCIIVDEKFQTSVSNVYAGGDVCMYPNRIFDNEMMNIAHWQTAQSHGRQASLAMMNQLPMDNDNSGFRSVTFFWSSVFGKGIRFAGIIDDPDNCYIDGDLNDLHFAAYYFRNDRVIGVATIARDPLASAFGALLRDNKIITKQDIESDPMAWFENNFS
uniref:Apoptosis-inducing factor 3-like n=1 Tax=Dermatophagoides pteronyssinus TaxID=6956 RepID=A0A6P6XPV0_DERPT|nr:apoptosis-inducing factor 3-like [Dermatophagoides pteronyssinus]